MCTFLRIIYDPSPTPSPTQSPTPTLNLKLPVQIIEAYPGVFHEQPFNCC